MWTTFVGFMGSGKTTVADALQAASGRPVVHLDEAVAARAGCRVAEIFARDGEPAFRDLELQELAALDPARNLVVDTGGGIVQTPAAVELMRERGVVIWLDAPWETIRARLKGGAPGERPLVDRLGWAGLEELFRGRRQLYAAAADFRLPATAAEPAQLARTAMLRSLVWSRRRPEQRR